MSMNENLKESFLDESTILIQETEQELIIDNGVSSTILSDNLTNDNKKNIIPDINLENYLKFLTAPYVDIHGNEVNLYISFSIDEIFLSHTSFYVHFGSYDDVADNWESLKIEKEDIQKNDQGSYTIHKRWVIPCRGNFGATVFASYPTNQKPVWQGTVNNDAKFRIENDCFFTIEKILKRREDYKNGAKKLLLDGIKKYSSFKELISALHANSNSKYLSEVVYDATHGDEKLRDIISDYYQKAKKDYLSEHSYKAVSSAKELYEMLTNLGIREIVFISPEGPHALSGGLAEVMKGLLKALVNKGISVTLISVLYEFEQGSKHPSADYALKTGIKFGNHILKPKYSGEISIPFGKTTCIRTGATSQNAFHARATVHIAKQDNFKLVLLRSKRFADYLYAKINPDEQFRRAIFLSRGALEVINNPIFDMNPQVIVSNDWVTGLVPPLLKLDSRYSTSLAFKDVKTVHIIHNCGRDYHGNIPVNYHGENLFQMLELDPVHVSGLVSPQNKGMLNLTASAIFHLNGALLTVSRPYAEELLDWNKGEGLTDLIKTKPGALFGISNGIDQISIRRKVIDLGSDEFENVISPEDDKSYYSKIFTFKDRIKTKLQKDLGLEVNTNAKLFSFIGRIAEQKGIELMYNKPAGQNVSVIEAILMYYPESQFVIAGPYTEGDVHARNLKSCIDYLSSKYPNRVKGIYNFVSHEYAIEIHAGSDFFMMPSRYEPGGITQLEAIACGTLVIGRNVGGISATLHNYGDLSDESNAFMFDTYTSDAFYQAMCYGLNVTKDGELRKALILQAAKSRHDWVHRAESHMALFQYVTGILNPYESYKHLEKRVSLANNACTY